MGMRWKIFVALAVVLPLGAFVAGSLVASAADDPPATNAPSGSTSARGRRNFQSIRMTAPSCLIVGPE
jgi:hypothetical protein